MSDTVTTDLSAITLRVAGIDASTPFGDVMNTLGLITELKKRLAEIEKEAKDAAVEQLRKVGSITIGTVRHYAGATIEKKDRDAAKTTERLIEAVEGDWTRFKDCLSANAYKPGECQKVFEAAKHPEWFEECFEVKEKWEMREGKPQPKLQKIDSRFVK